MPNFCIKARWTIRKTIRNNPAKARNTFLLIEENMFADSDIIGIFYKKSRRFVKAKQM